MAALLAKQGLNPTAFKAAPKRVSRRTLQPVRAGAAAAEDVPDMNKRNIMNLVLAGGVGLPAVGLAGPFALFFVPPGYVEQQQHTGGASSLKVAPVVPAAA